MEDRALLAGYPRFIVFHRNTNNKGLLHDIPCRGPHINEVVFVMQYLWNSFQLSVFSNSTLNPLCHALGLWVLWLYWETGHRMLKKMIRIIFRGLEQLSSLSSSGIRLKTVMPEIKSVMKCISYKRTPWSEWFKYINWFTHLVDRICNSSYFCCSIT